MHTRRTTTRRRTTARRLLAPLVALLTVSVAGCQLPSVIHRPTTSPPVRTSTPTPSAAASSTPEAPVEHLLSRIDGISDAHTVTGATDLDCEPGEDKVTKLDVRFTAADATAMRTALLAGRSYERNHSDLDYLCLIGTYRGDRRTVQIDLTNSFSGADDTWPSASMIKALVRSSRLRLNVGRTPLRWAATADIDSDLSVGSDLDQDAPADATAIDVFTQLQQHWKPLKGYDSVDISVATKSGGDLDASQQDGPITPWKANLPAGMITIFRTELADLKDVQMSRLVTDGEVDDRFDFLYADSESSMSWPRRQQVAHRVITAYWALPAKQRGDSFSIRSGPHTELDFNTTSCNGILPGMNHRQDAPQTRALYRWYAQHYPKQAKKGGVAHCLGKHI